MNTKKKSYTYIFEIFIDIFDSILYTWNPVQELFLENDTQTPPPSPKVAKLGFWTQKIRNVMERLQEHFSDFSLII